MDVQLNFGHVADEIVQALVSYSSVVF